MKKGFLVIVVMLALFMAGCSGFGEGAIVGAAATGAIDGLITAQKQHEQELVAKHQAALAELEQATTEVKAQAAAVRAKAIEDELEKSKLIAVGAEVGKQGVKTNWNDPVAVGAFSNTAAIALAAWFLRRKRNSLDSTS